MKSEHPLTFGEVFSEILYEERLRKTAAAARLNVSDAAIHKLVNDGNSPSIDRALSVLNEFGYSLAVVRSDNFEEVCAPLKKGKE